MIHITFRTVFMTKRGRGRSHHFTTIPSMVTRHCSRVVKLKIGEVDRRSKGSCVFFDGILITSNSYQFLSVRGKAKGHWKRSIRHHGKSLKALTSDGLLIISPWHCLCEKCNSKVIFYQILQLSHTILQLSHTI